MRKSLSIASARCVFVGHSRCFMPSKTPLQGETPRPDFTWIIEPTLAFQPILHPKLPYFAVLNIVNINRIILITNQEEEEIYNFVYIHLTVWKHKTYTRKHFFATSYPNLYLSCILFSESMLIISIVRASTWTLWSDSYLNREQTWLW